ncbi:PREDICTED: centrosomal protein kizuna [Chrysochloris asiatica]|uniref:Centrosomal protein kizuna n=1 Tax=Chrysochloris asiatica TaxID=185453 RepID=A0A9B0T891_CHRAS|nr:PREDICTED: centrosomal protein kizuna [Chrysochloris asiatica]
MRRTSDPTAPLASPDYYESLCRLQHGLRDSEKKRLDLERKLYEYSQSDTCRVKLKYVKLKKYLKEICESEKKAHTRNRNYLKQCEHVQAHTAHFTTNTEKLKELKIEYETQIKKIHLLSKDSLGIKGELKDEDSGKVAIQAGINSGIALSRGLYQPATTFMGRQMSAISNTGDFSTEQKPPQPTKNFSIPVLHSCQQTAQSSNVTDSCVVQTNSDTQCLNKCDRTDGKTSLQIGDGTPVTASVLPEEGKTHCLEIGSNIHHSKSNLSESKKSAELHCLLRERLSPENRTTDLKCDSSSRSEGSEEEILTEEHIEVKEEAAGPPVSPISVSEYYASENKCSQENHSAWEGFLDGLPHGDSKSQRLFGRMQEQEEESWSSSSDLTVSVSEDDLFSKSPPPQTKSCDKMEGEDGIKAFKVIHSGQEKDALVGKKNNYTLQSLRSPDSEKESSTDSPTRESERPPYSDLLSTQVGQHVTTLKEQDDSLSKEATALLKKAHREECADRSIHSDESSCSLPSILNDNGGIKEAKLSPWLNSVHTREQDVSSCCKEESKEGSVATTIPVTETKAYQLLKKSTLQDNTHQTKDRFQKADAHSVFILITGLNIGSGTFQTKTTNKITLEGNFSSSKGSPLSRHESQRKLTANLNSKAFWGESDDSNSEIEAVLCPRNHNTSTDDFDDFYD